MKNITKKFFSLTCCSLLILSVSTTCLANPSEEVEVSASKASTFMVTIPKKITLSGETGSGSFTVSVTGDLSEGDTVSIVPDEDFTMMQEGKNDITVTVSQDKTAFTKSDFVLQQDGSKVASSNGTLQMSEISAGVWEGSFDFTISTNFDTTNSSVDEVISTTVISYEDM